VHYSVQDDDDGPTRAALETLQTAGHPVFTIALPEPEALGGEFLRWEIATATAGALLGVNPFDEPDVLAAKQATADLLDRRASEGRFPEASARASQGGVDLFSNGDGQAPEDASVAAALSEWLDVRSDGGYVAVLGYFDSSPECEAAVGRLRQSLTDRTGLATTFGYGPRYLHSTGQLHKGGPEQGLFLVLTADPVEDVPVPGSDFSLGTLQRAQALGDVRTLRKLGRSVLHAHLGWYVEEGLQTLVDALDTTAR